MEKTRSNQRVVESKIEIKRWMEEVPSVGDARPKRCVACLAVGTPLGKPIVIVGHGTRSRNVIGPRHHEDVVGGMHTILLRRFLCRACDAVLTVVPRGVLFRRRYSAFAIAWALALFGLVRLTATVVRERVTRWRAMPHTVNLGWAALIHWARAVRDGRLFPGLPRSPPDASLRRVAERTAMALAAEAPTELRAFREDIRAGYGGIVVGKMAIAV